MKAARNIIRNTRYINNSITTNVNHHIYSNNYNQINHFSSRSMVTITTNSWASERLVEQGEKLQVVNNNSVQLLSEETLLKPTEKVTKLSDEILALNMIEVNQLLKVLTVCIYVYFYPYFYYYVYAIAQLSILTTTLTYTDTYTIPMYNNICTIYRRD